MVSRALYPNVRTLLVQNLETGSSYDFKIEALNFNGASALSDAASFIICTEPQGFYPAAMTQVTRTTLQLTW